MTCEAALPRPLSPWWRSLAHLREEGQAGRVRLHTVQVARDVRTRIRTAYAVSQAGSRHTVVGRSVAGLLVVGLVEVDHLVIVAARVGGVAGEEGVGEHEDERRQEQAEPQTTVLHGLGLN
ncbi:MAG TPA: hypothetical protein VGE30_01435 [Candidatus Saccharimonadales bacterium]